MIIAEFRDRLREVVTDIVARQRATGIDLVNDGEGARASADRQFGPLPESVTKTVRAASILQPLSFAPAARCPRQCSLLVEQEGQQRG